MFPRLVERPVGKILSCILDVDTSDDDRHNDDSNEDNKCGCQQQEVPLFKPEVATPMQAYAE